MFERSTRKLGGLPSLRRGEWIETQTQKQHVRSESESPLASAGGVD